MAFKDRTEADPGTRLLGVVSGLWLAATGFLLPQPLPLALVAWVVGGLIALASLGPSPIPLAATLLAVVLAVATLVLPGTTQVIVANNLAVAIVVFVGGLIPIGTRRWQAPAT